MTSPNEKHYQDAIASVTEAILHMTHAVHNIDQELLSGTHKRGSKEAEDLEERLFVARDFKQQLEAILSDFNLRDQPDYRAAIVAAATADDE